MYEDTDYELGPAVIKDCEYIQSIYPDYTQRLYKDISKSNFITVISHYVKQDINDLVIYFNGHGSQVGSSNESSESDGKDEVLIFKKSPAFQVDSPTWDNNKKSSSPDDEIRIMKDDELSKLVSKNKCKHILFIFDCCHSDTMIDIDDLPANVSCLYSCKQSEVSYQNKESGIFTKHLAKNANYPLNYILTVFDESYNQHPVLRGERQYLHIRDNGNV
jgi:hypothetical protein